jgi:hypothetical protein
MNTIKKRMNNEALLFEIKEWNKDDINDVETWEKFIIHEDDKIIIEEDLSSFLDKFK